MADTDVPETVVALVKQRRRWLNGAFFTLLYFLLNWWRVLAVTKHSLIRKLGFIIQFFYLVINLALYWFTIGNLYLSFYIVMSITVATEQQMSGLLVGYGALLMIQFVFALGTQAKDFPSIYLWFSVLHGLIMLVTVGSLFTYLALTASTDAVFLIGTVGVASYALVTVVYGEVCFVLSSAIQYLFMVCMGKANEYCCRGLTRVVLCAALSLHTAGAHFHVCHPSVQLLQPPRLLLGHTRR